jgi:hypothetical protein
VAAVGPTVAKWFQERRGIRAETLDAFGITLERVKDEMPLIKMPYPGAAKFRHGLEKDGRKFWWDPPSAHGQALFTPPNAGSGKHMILVEGETDTMALWQHAPAAVKPTIRGLPGTESWGEHFLPEFADASIVYVILDNESAYDNESAFNSVERGWQKISRSLGNRARRVRLPQGTQDICEFLSTYSWAALKVLIDAATEVELPYKRLVFGGPEPQFDWYVKDLLVQGDIALMAGHGGTGKSFYTSALALATLGVLPDWLGIPVLNQGPVIVVDQENPQVTVQKRMYNMGLREDHPDLHYLWYQGVRLDSDPERLYEYARMVQPKLIVIDTISRTHMASENDAKDMNPLMNAAIYPLSREIGATVILIHHLARAGNTRGSTALSAAVDMELHVRNELIDPRKADEFGNRTGQHYITPNKLRQVPEWGTSLLCSIKDTEDGVRVSQVGPPDMEAVC